MVTWMPNTTATRGPKGPKLPKKNGPTLRPAPKTAAAPAGQFDVGGAPRPLATPAPFMLPPGTVPWALTPAPTAPGKDPSTDSSWQDSGFNSTIANLLSQRDQGRSALVAAGRRAAEDRDRNTSLIGEGRAKAKTATTQSANKSGLFYSGTLGKNLGDVDTDYDRRTTDTNTAYTRGEEDRAAASAGLDSAFNQAQQAAAQQAIDRWIKGAAPTEDANTPSLAALIAALTGANTAPKARAR